MGRADEPYEVKKPIGPDNETNPNIKIAIAIFTALVMGALIFYQCSK